MESRHDLEAWSHRSALLTVDTRAWTRRQDFVSAPSTPSHKRIMSGLSPHDPRAIDLLPVMSRFRDKVDLLSTPAVKMDSIQRVLGEVRDNKEWLLLSASIQLPPSRILPDYPSTAPSSPVVCPGNASQDATLCCGDRLGTDPKAIRSRSASTVTEKAVGESRSQPEEAYGKQAELQLAKHTVTRLGLQPKAGENPPVQWFHPSHAQKPRQDKQLCHEQQPHHDKHPQQAKPNWSPKLDSQVS